ncbi:hypothetical protein A2867_03630 [Candidatus Daviesbacteria bacterium RIFCSPHIGHO2_01_FULL_40_11]|uniref:Uncharacterized protein n=1 Tax=Candidatus Daviesbacteria bacterium RIFCSPHIGHO2_01_FULL_40_11 TaxID=1797762 RepID=A0A1F5JH89_9BACT|nr:MAG: hypothetical protein A2867_03630 [Candidatus Daviesbacteria bacterium RIFCSPHIGHO2_01_FULL_40_11]
MLSKLTIEQILGGCQYPKLAWNLKNWKQYALKNKGLEKIKKDFGLPRLCLVLGVSLGQGLVPNRGRNFHKILQ